MSSVKIIDSIPQLCLAIVAAQGVRIEPASVEFRDCCERIVKGVVEFGTVGGEHRQKSIRDLLRTGGYKPAGRGKPAQEYLFKTAEKDGRLPSIVNAVDLINVVSVSSGLPVSLLSADRIGDDVSIRFGTEGESYVFNSVEQTLDLKGLICVCAERDGRSIPMGTPVKDSQYAKVDEDDRNVVAFIYGSLRTVGKQELEHWASELSNGFRRWCSAEEVSYQLM